MPLAGRPGRRLPRPNARPPIRQLVQLAAAWGARLLARGALVATARPATVRCLVHPGRLLRRTRRQILQACKLVLDRLMLSLQFLQSEAELLILCPQTPNLPNQFANRPNKILLPEPF